ncbi:MAG: polysaccharide deacetylase family protein [Alphaproteobacteria bacterium]|nr:polysaccharide deacetylase family protein [Alphaproteobacteria bacterium]
MAILLTGWSALTGPAYAEIPADNNSAVIFVYQRVGEDALSDRNIPLEQFKAHLREIKSGDYNILPLQEIVDRLQDDKNPLPSRTIAITFDGAWLPTMNNVIPLLKKEKLPFTVFVLSDAADAGNDQHMDWTALKKLRKNKLADIGLLPAVYEYMTDNTEAENADTMNRAVTKYREIFKDDPTLFAWPYGAYTKKLQEKISAYGFKAAVGQQSGVAHAGSDMMALPRFIMTGEYGDLDRFRLTVRARPLPVSDVMPDSPGLDDDNQPIIGFTLAPELQSRAGDLSCFVSDIGKTDIQQLGGNRIEIRLDTSFFDKKNRINCTMPTDNADEWRWFGMILVSKNTELTASAGNQSE